MQILNLQREQMKNLIGKDNVNEKVAIFNNTILNILSNFNPHEAIVCDDKDAPWFNNSS